MQVGQGRLDFGEILVVGGRDLVTRQEVLGEGLGAFQLRCTLGWAEAVQATAAEQVDHPDDQWCFRADDGQVDVFLGKVGQLFQGAYVDGDVLALGFNGGAGVAGATKTFSTRGSWATFQARACSRPPLPMIKTFMSKPRILSGARRSLTLYEVAMKQVDARRGRFR